MACGHSQAARSSKSPFRSGDALDPILPADVGVWELGTSLGVPFFWGGVPFLGEYITCCCHPSPPPFQGPNTGSFLVPEELGHELRSRVLLPRRRPNGLPFAFQTATET